MSIFDEVIDRKNSNSLKYDEMTTSFGTNDLLPLWVADMDFLAPKPVLDALSERLSHGIFGYTSRPDSYFEAFAKWHLDHHQHPIDTAHVLHAPTVVASLSTLIRVLTKPEDPVLIQTPVYYPFKNITESNGRVVVPNPLKVVDGRYQFDLEDLDSKIQETNAKLLILCNPHNPVGRVWERDELLALSNLCQRHGVTVIADEIHGDFALFGHKYTPFATLNDYTKANTITCLSTSKTFNLAGLQASFIVIPQEDIRKETAHALYFQDIARNNCFSLVATEAALTHGAPWLSELKSYLEENILFLETYSQKNLPGFVPIRPEGTYLVWVDLSGWNLSGEDLDHFFIKDAGVAIDSGHWFGADGNSFARFNVACPRATLTKALDKIQEAAIKRGFI